MEHLNYCRQVVRQFEQALKNPEHPYRSILEEKISIIAEAQKFQLPCGGRLHDDKTFKALDETRRLHLPFPVIAIEYQRAKDKESDCVAEGEGRSSKTIIVAKEHEDWIVLHIIIWIDHLETWGPMPEIAIPRVNYLNRKTINESGRTGILALPRDITIPMSDYQDELGAFLCFLNILQCANVHTESDRPRPLKNGAKNALPFDEYHYLTISKYSETENDARRESKETGNHRSPREHLRRGHIRRLSRMMVWVNATVVNPGGTGGKITKEYVMGKAR